MDCSRFIIRSGSLLLAAILLWGPVPSLYAANVCDPTVGTRCQKIDTAGNANQVAGPSTRTTYVASVSAAAAATTHTLTLEASATTGFKLSWYCVGVSNATAASSVVFTVARRTTASSAGTALTAEGTGANSISKMDPNAASYGGVARLDGTLGTIGAVMDQVNYQVGIIATGAGSLAPYCQYYGISGNQMPTVAAGVANGLTINIPSLGAGSLAVSMTAAIIVE